MIDVDVMVVIIALFSLNYGALWVVYRRVNTFNTAIKILCREHAKNHGNSEIEL